MPFVVGVCVRSCARIVVRVSACLGVVIVSQGFTAAAAATVVAQAGDAAIAHDESAGSWQLSAGGAALTIVADSARDFTIASLVSPSGRLWSLAAGADTFVRVGGRTLAFGGRASGFAYQNASVSARGNGFELRIDYGLQSAGLSVARHYAIVPGSPTFEAWTSFSPAGGAATLSDLNALLLTVPAGTIHWVTGLQGDAADVASDGAFTLEQRTLATGEHFTLGAQRRAS